MNPANILHCRYGSAREFLQDYREYLSKSAVFVRGEFDFAPLTRVAVSIELIGLDPIVEKAEVVHLADNGVALSIAAADFKQKITRVRQRLLGRRSHFVFVTNPRVEQVMLAAGYGTQHVGSAGDWLESLAKLPANAPAPVTVCVSKEIGLYDEASQSAPMIVVPIVEASSPDSLVREIDEILLPSTVGSSL